MKKEIRIAYLYGDLMNTYGDRGNIISVINRCTWREIDTTVKEISLGHALRPSYDLYFFGGGQDQQQKIVGEDLVGEKADVLREAVQDGAALLAICGGYQLLGQYYKPRGGDPIPGAHVFPAHTVAGNTRMIGNLVVRLKKDLISTIKDVYPYCRRDLSLLVGFENHSGKTRMAENPLGSVVIGSGNNGEDGSEGCIVRHAIGCYLHGSLLPKNPHLADYLIAAALKHHYKEPIPLKMLDDSLEWRAHDAAVKRAHQLLVH